MNKVSLKNKIENILQESIGKVDNRIVKAALDLSDNFKLENDNDIHYLVYKATLRNQTIKKTAYPSGDVSGSSGVVNEFDLEKWGTLVHSIYDAVTKQQMSFVNALDYYSSFLSKKNHEQDNFKKWVYYHKNGESKKYSSSDDMLKKNALQGGLLTGFYDEEFSPKPPAEIQGTVDAEKNAFQNKKLKEEQYKLWREKLNSSIRRVDKLLRAGEDHVDPDSAVELSELLHAFDRESRKIRHKSTASDYASVLSNKFYKRGFSEGGDIFKKLAQDVAPPEGDVGLGPKDGIGEQLDEPDDAPDLAGGGAVPGTGEDDSRSPISDTLRESSTAAPGEYEELAGHISIDLAASKLEDIAARLSDRRSIRLLAELDIMLDKLGIAPMFPELAEAQSKLIDSYTYALVRVTKMLGMLASGKNLSEIASAKTREMDNKTMREVNKTFEGQEGDEEPKRGTDELNKEFSPEAEGNAPQAPPAAPKPQAGPEPTI